MPVRETERKLHEIWSVLDQLTSKFQEIHSPEENLVIDRSHFAKRKIEFRVVNSNETRSFWHQILYTLSELASSYVYKVIICVREEELY